MDRRRFVKSVGCAGTLAAATQLPAGTSCMDEMMRLSQNRPSARGMSYVVLDKDKTFAEQVKQENTIYEIRYDFDLGGEMVPILQGCVLKFEGGCLENGTIKGIGSSVLSDNQCFKEVSVIGAWNGISKLEWWCKPSILTIEDSKSTFALTNIDCTKDFQYALDADFCELHINGYYYITDTVVLKKYKRLALSGLPITYSFAYKGRDSMLSSYVFSDKNITLLRIAPDSANKYANNQISIEGGNFDVSQVDGYSANCIEVDIRENRKIWGLNIDCGINGYQTAYSPATGCGIKFLTDEGSGYATMVRIKGSIMWFGIGVHVHDALPCWITDVEINGIITNCANAIDCNTDIYINASIQPYTGFTNEAKRDVPLINIAGGRAVIGGMIWDLASKTSDKDGNLFYANDVAINIGDAQHVSVIGKIKQLGYDHRNSHVTGNVGLLREHDYTMGDKYNVVPNIAYNCFEAFTKQGGACCVTLHNSDGTQIEEGITVSNIEKVFNSTSSAAKISLDSYNREDGRYVEINLSNINLLVQYFAFTTTTSNFGFGRYSIELINNGSVVRSVANNVSPLTYGKLTIFDIHANGWFNVSDVRIRLYEIFDYISIHKVIGNILATEYDGYRPSFLPISGGTVYGKTEFKVLSIPSGSTKGRPSTEKAGEVFFDTTLGKPIWWNGTAWVDATGATV